MQILKGKTALVTGVGRSEGIGAAICRALAEQGVDIFYTYWSTYDKNLFPETESYKPEDFAKELETFGVRAHGAEIDLSQEKASATLFDLAEAELGTPDILINNACYDVAVPFHKLTVDVVDRHYFVNVRAPILLCVEFIKRWNKSEGGRIINMTSGQTLGAMNVDQISYTTTKAALEMLAKQLAPGLISRGITINAVDPGPTDTGWMSEELKEQVKKESAKGRITVPADVAQAIVGIIEDSEKNGQVIHVER